jgi:flagellar biosynthesis anti-sigma factor FlgM
MRIEPPTTTRINAAEQSAENAAAGINPNPQTTAEERTSRQAEFSSAQSRAAALTAHLNQLPEVRHQRVAAIAAAITSGTYQVSPEQTADAILSELHARSSAAA